MNGHEVTTAFSAILPLAEGSLLECSQMLGTAGDFNRVGLPKRECVDRSARPGSAGLAMAVAHRFRLPGNLNIDGSAKTLALVRRHE
jgi:hypothetical protein